MSKNTTKQVENEELENEIEALKAIYMVCAMSKVFVFLKSPVG